MAMFIVLTAEQAAAVRGVSPVAKWAAIEPIVLEDGSFILNDEVLTDPAHSSKTRALTTLTKYDRATIEARLVKEVVEKIDSKDASVELVDGA